MTSEQENEVVDLVARMLYKAQYPLRRWVHTKSFQQKWWVERAKKALDRVRRDERLTAENRKVFG